MAPDVVLPWTGDTLLVPDMGNQRLNWIVPGKGVVSTRQYLVADARLRGARAVGMLADGHVVLRARAFDTPPDSSTGARRTVSYLVVMDRVGEARDIGSVLDEEMVSFETRYRGRSRQQLLPPRLGRRALVAAWGASIATNDGDGYRIRLRGVDGRVTREIRVAVPRRAVTKSMRDAQIARETEQFSGMHTERMVDPAESRRLITAVPFADSLPPLEDLLVGRDGTLWAVDVIAPGDERWHATAFGTDGAIVGRLTVPGTGRPVAFDGERVVVRMQDADGVVSFRVYQLVPADRR